MSPERLTEIRQRLERASEGHWEGDLFTFEPVDIPKQMPRIYTTNGVTLGFVRWWPDHDVWMHSKADIADLLAEVERLREAYSKMRDAAKVYYTISRNETYIREEDLPPVFHKLPEPSND
jgi:hypothetical protein